MFVHFYLWPTQEDKINGITVLVFSSSALFVVDMVSCEHLVFMQTLILYNDLSMMDRQRDLLQTVKERKKTWKKTLVSEYCVFMGSL